MTAALAASPMPSASGYIRGPLPSREECHDCPFAGPDGRAKAPVCGIGPQNPRFVVWAESPGVNEARQGVPLIGASGELLNRALATVGAKRSEIHLGNTLICQPPYGCDKDKAFPKVIAHCQNRAWKELEATGDVPILALGKWAFNFLVPDAGLKVTEAAGAVFKTTIAGHERIVIPTLHPAHLLRGGGGEGNGAAHAVDVLYWNLIYDLGKIRRLADGAQDLFVDNFQVEYKDPLRAERLLANIAREARQVGLIAVDTETQPVRAKDCEACTACSGHSALESNFARLYAVGLATPTRAVSVAWPILRPAGRDIIKRLLADSKVAKAFHNRTYDEVVLTRHGMPLGGPVHCTLLMHHSAFPGLDHKLQRVATQFFLIQPWKSEFRHGRGTAEELHVYNARDTHATAKLVNVLQVCVKKSLSERTYAMDTRMAEIAAKMTMWGIPVSLIENAKLIAELKPRIVELEAKLVARVADPDAKRRFFEVLAGEKAKKKRKRDAVDYMLRFAQRLEEVQEDFTELNLDAKDQVVALLKACGVPLVAVTEKGATSTRKEVLQSLATNPVVKDVLIYRGIEDLYGTFVEPIARELDRDGRTHPVWSVHMITGRWSSKKNWQNHHKGNPRIGTPNIRRQMVAPEGRMLVGADFAQLEMRIIGLLSGEPYLVDAFLKGVDIHSELSKLAFSGFAKLEPKSPTWKEQRDHMKRCEYAYAYRAQPLTAWKQSFVKEGHDVSLQTVMDVFRILKERMPRVEAWHQAKYIGTQKKGELREFVLGRRRAFPLGQLDPTVVANFDVQAAAAAIMDTGLDRFYARMPEHVKILIQGHDSLVVECDEDKVESIRDLLVDSLTQEYTVGDVTMPFTVEADIAKSWDKV